MMSRARYVVIGTITLALVAGTALAQGLQWLAIYFGLDDPFVLGFREVTLSKLIGFVLAASAAIFVLRHRPTFALANEVVDELSKVTWPSREETGTATMVVIVTVLISSVYLGAFDAMWLFVTDWILGIHGLPEG